MKVFQLALRILAGITLGAIFALVFRSIGGNYGEIFLQISTFTGTLFMNALKMTIVPLVVSSLIIGIATLDTKITVARLTSYTFIYYIITTLCAIIVALVIGDIFLTNTQQAPAEILNTLGTMEKIDQEMAKNVNDFSVFGVLLRAIPSNVIVAAYEGQMLGLVFFSLFFGFFARKLKNKGAKTIIAAVQGIHDIVLEIILFVLKVAPIGAFMLVGKAVYLSGFDLFTVMANFIIAVLLALFLHFFVVLPAIVFFVAKRNPWQHMRLMLPALATAFSTSSSSATYPVTLKTMIDVYPEQEDEAALIIPLGATVNMDGTSLYITLATLFIASLYGMELSLVQQIFIVVLGLVTSIGTPGIPSAGIIAIAVLLSALGLPTEAIALILAFDRLLDMLRTTVNVYGDTCGVLVVSRLLEKK